MNTGTTPDKEPYVPIGERINQDVWHDNFVPKYSALASAKPKLVVILGVWMIFGPWAIFSLLYVLGILEESESQFSFWFFLPFELGLDSGFSVAFCDELAQDVNLGVNRVI